MCKIPDAFDMNAIYQERQEVLKDERREEVAIRIAGSAWIGCTYFDNMPEWLKLELELLSYDVTKIVSDLDGSKTQYKVDWRNCGLNLSLV